MAAKKSSGGGRPAAKKSIARPPAAKKRRAQQVPEPEPAYSLTVPISPAVRAVYGSLSADTLNSFLEIKKGPATTAPAADAAQLQVRKSGRWVSVNKPGRTNLDWAAPFLLPDLSSVLQASQGDTFRRASALGTENPAVEPGTLLPTASFAEAILSIPPVPLAELNTRLSVVSGGLISDLKPVSNRVNKDMDPRLQLAVINKRAGKQSVAISSATGEEVPVIARVASMAKWEEMPDVHTGADLGKAQDGTTIVTGRVAVDRLEAVRADPAVFSLKASQPVHTALAKTAETMGVRAADLVRAGITPGGGRGVVVGIVDTGGDFAHQNFLKPDGSTRLLALWDQSGVARANSPFGYGRLYSTAEIDAALQAPNPYAALGYGPRPDTPNEQGQHGTHVMDIAAGNGAGTGLPGVAPDADIVFVEISATDIAWTGPDVVKQSFGDSAQMLEAVKYIFELAGDRPCVVNLSLGTNGGPHDGTSLLEQGMDALVNAKPNRAIVIAASNSQTDDIHTSGIVGMGQSVDLGWTLIEEAGGEFELWYEGNRRLEITLIGPDGTQVATVQPGNSQPLALGSQVAIFISSRLGDPNNNCNVIGIWVAGGVAGGTWTVRLRSLSNAPVDYHAWLERLDGSQSSFVTPVPTHTLGSISTGYETIVVGSYDAHKAAFPLSSFSSSGPTRDGRQKPEISAPGGNVIAARSRTRNGLTRKSGTSMAAPAVTGLVALMMAEATRNGIALSSAQLRAKLLAGADPAAPVAGAGAWDPRSGAGRASSRAI